MSKKDIITLVICFLLIGVSAFYIWNLYAPKKTQDTTTTEIESRFTGNIDQEVMKKVEQRHPYSESTLEGIGRANPFNPL